MSDAVVPSRAMPVAADRLSRLDDASTSRAGAFVFGAACVAAIGGAAALAGLAPIGLSVFAVFLFAGPHNWMEFRYFLSRMPARWGRRAPFYRTALFGCVGLSVAYVGMAVAVRAAPDAVVSAQLASSFWMTGLVAWLATLGAMRKLERRGDPTLVLAVACFAVGGVWLLPGYGEIALVFLHPCVALVFFDRLLRRHRPAWRPVWRLAACTIPAAVVGFAIVASRSGDVVGDDFLSSRIAQGVGAGQLPWLSPRFLVSTHAFLELLHYGVWIFAAPWLVRGQVPWNVDRAPLAKSAPSWKWALRGVVYGGALAAVALWLCFFANYGLTRDVYFTVAIVHVLAEFAFLAATK